MDRGGAAACVSWLQTVILKVLFDDCVCTRVQMYMIPCARVHMWRSEDNFVESVPLLCGVLGLDTLFGLFSTLP